MPDNQLGDFLRARRELARPEEHGLPDLGRRRVPGLRREEVAMLAGISAEYYVRLERGRDRHPSVQVLDALARVLDLDDESREYLASLVTARPPRPAPTSPDSVSPSVRRLLQAAGDIPAFVLGRFMDVLAANRCAEILHGDRMPENMVRYTFLDDEARAVFPDWADVAAETVASLRSAVVDHLDDPQLTRLIGELSLKSADFRRLWARHDVRAKTAGTKRLITPTVGEVTVHWETLAVTAAPGQLVVTYFAEPGSPSEAALRRVAELAAAAAES